MTTKELEKVRKCYINMVTSPQYNFPPKTPTEAQLDWLTIDIAIVQSGVLKEKDNG